MKQHEEVTFQTLANNEDIQIGYSDNDIMVVDSIQQFTEVNTAHVAMNAVIICTNGKVQAQMNGKQICEKLAFPTPSFFGKYVKDHFGMTPLELRNS